MSVEIVPVDGISKFMTFCRIPRQIYKGMDGFAAPLDVERWTLFGRRFNPHFKLVDSQAFLAKKDGRFVGRIMAQAYTNGFKPVGTSPCQFGCLDAVDDQDVVSALLDAAEDWLKTKGADTIVGPFSPSIWGEVGMLIDGYTSMPMIFVPWHPRYLPDLVEAHGYSKARDVYSYRYDVRPSDREVKGSIMARPEWAERLKIRTLDLKHLEKEAPAIVDIFNDGWSENWGFVPFTLEEFLSVGDSLKYVMPENGGFLVELDGVPQAFGIVLPNLHEIVADLDGTLLPFGLPKVISRVRNHAFKSGRLALFGIRRALHRKAVGGVVILAFIEELRRRSRSSSIDQVEFGWVLEDNAGMRRPIEFSGAQVDKIHRVYEKHLSA